MAAIGPLAERGAGFGDLPEDVMMGILYLLDAESLHSLECSCTTMRTMINQEQFWQEMWERRLRQSDTKLWFELGGKGLYRILYQSKSKASPCSFSDPLDEKLSLPKIYLTRLTNYLLLVS